MGITAAEKARVPRTRVREVAGKQQGVRVFVVQSQQREDYERAQRERSMERVREELERVRVRVQKGQLKKPEKIGAAAAYKQLNEVERGFAHLKGLLVL